MENKLKKKRKELLLKLVPLRNKSSEFTPEEMDIIISSVTALCAQDDDIRPGDVVTDDGYHGRMVVTRIDGGLFSGYYVEDGVVRGYLELSKFRKVEDSVGQWMPTRTGARFALKEEINNG